jgi:hypothetical protein
LYPWRSLTSLFGTSPLVILLNKKSISLGLCFSSSESPGKPEDGRFEEESEIRTNEEEWDAAAKEGKSLNMTIHVFIDMHSGSRLLKREFVTMRVV